MAVMVPEVCERRLPSLELAVWAYVELAALLVVVADLQVAQNAGLVQVAQLDHVLHALGRGGVHDFQLFVGFCRGYPEFLEEEGAGGGEEEGQSKAGMREPAEAE